MMKRTFLFSAVLMLIFACTPASQEQIPSGDEGKNNPSQSDDPSGPGGDEPGETPSAEPDFSPEGWYATNYWQRSDREKAGLRGPVKKWYLSKSSAHREYHYNEAGNITLIRDVDPESSRGEWMEQRFYDDNGRLVKKIWGRSKQKGGMEFDEWASLEVWKYEYDNPGKYVLTASSISSRTPFRFLSPESFSEHQVENTGDFIMKDLSAVRCTNESSMMTDARAHYDYEYSFDGTGNLTVRYHSYSTAYDLETGEEGDILGADQGYEEWTNEDVVVYKDNYPYSVEIIADGRTLSQVTSMTWRDNGMPLKMEGMDGISEFDPQQKRYICMTRWECQPGNPSDGLFVFTFWETFQYNKAGDLIEHQERFNEESDNPWTRPTTWELEYDSHGNWISYKEKYMIAVDGPDGEVKDGSMTRTVEYY